MGCGRKHKNTGAFFPPPTTQNTRSHTPSHTKPHTQAQAAVGSAGLPALAAALRRTPRNADVTRAVLEALTLAVGDGLGGGGAGQVSVVCVREGGGGGR